ncbi:aspartate dehydrogenase [Alcaligenaceae bacterium 429]|nr:aspartate dehydrogenase [Alcaligenaceae bacterium 429]
MKKVAFIGYGAMAKTVHALLPESIQLAWVVVTEAGIAATQQELGTDVQVVSSIDAMTGTPDLVLEMAGQPGLKAHAKAVLQRKLPLAVISVGAFADGEFEQDIRAFASAQGAQLQILPGAIAGIDGIAAARTMGLDKVVYQGRKQPASWKGSYAEQLVDLDALTEATVFFRGSAREAAQRFPANANVAATIALAGVGMDKTEVELIADPAMTRNQHRIRAEGAFGEMQIEMQGVALASNPKTSTLAALSVVRACYQLGDALVI